MTEPGRTGELKSHELSDVESSTPQRLSRDFGEGALPKSTVPSANPADIPLKSSGTNNTGGTTNVASGTPASTSEATQPAAGGGIVGAIRSLLGGGGTTQSTNTTSAVDESAPAQVTHESTLPGGTSAQVSTAPGHSAVPETLQQGQQPVGVAKTTFNEPVSPYAGALTGIAGEPEPSDPSKGYGHALDSLTGDAPVASSPGVISSVTAAAGNVVYSAVDTVKHAVGYETEDHVTNTSTSANPSTGVTPATLASPGTITYEDLPTTGRIHPHEDGSVDVGQGGASSLAARQAEHGTQTKPSSVGTSTGYSSGTPAVGTTGALSNIRDEVPKSGTVNATGDGTADIETAQRPGIFAAAVGAVGGGAQYVKDSVAGLVGGSQAGDTSEQIAALDRQNRASGTPGYESSTNVGSTPISYESENTATKPGVSYEGAGSGVSSGSKIPIAYETPVSESRNPISYETSGVTAEKSGAGPLSQPLTTNEAGPIVQEKPTVAYEESSEPSAATATNLGGSSTAQKGSSITPGSSSISSSAPTGSQTATTGGIATSSQPKTTVGQSATTGNLTGSSQPKSASDRDTVSSNVDKTAIPASGATGSSLVKEVGPTPSNATVDSTTKSGKENLRLPTGDVVESTQPKAATSSTAAVPKAATESKSSTPVVSAFATPSTSAAKPTASTTQSKATEPTGTTTKPVSDSVKPTTTSAQPASTKIADDSAVKGTTGSAVSDTKPTATKTAAVADTNPNATKTTGTNATTEKPTTAAEKEKKKGNKSCGCCVIS